MCIQLIRASNCRYAYISYVIVALIKEAIPNTSVERSKVISIIIVFTHKKFKHDNGMIIRNDNNIVIVID
ncbi:hypothetical protein DITRI_Ditri20bG0125000 [Diplodiscus trichospermus]